MKKHKPKQLVKEKANIFSKNYKDLFVRFFVKIGVEI